MATTLHFWDTGDASVGIGYNQAEISLDLDGASSEETQDNIAHAKEVLAKALQAIWDNGRVSCMTGEEINHNAEATPSPAPLSR